MSNAGSNVENFAFLHGGGQGGWIWDETVAAMALQSGGAVRAVAFDLPGCGTRRNHITSGLTVRDVAATFVADLAASGMTDITLVGHSNAGTILPLVAQMRPDLIRRYVYLSCIVPPPGKSVLEVMRRERSAFDESSVSGGNLRAMFCNDMTAADADAFMDKLHQDHWPTVEALRTSDWEYDHLNDRRSTYIICLRDQALLPDWQKEFAARVHAETWIYLDAGHQAMNTRPHALAEILLDERRLEHSEN